MSEHDTPPIAITMFASHYTPAAQARVLPLLHPSKSVKSTAVLRSMSLARSPRRQQQTRGFRFGIWSSYLVPGSERDQGRHKSLKHKYAEALSRRLRWDRHNATHIGHSGMKSFMCSAWHERKSNINLQKLQHDSARAAVYLARATSGSFHNASNAATHRGQGRTLGNDGAESFAKYDIDPITNRKILKHDSSPSNSPSTSSSHNIPVRTFKDYPSQSSKLRPPDEHSSQHPGVIHLGSPPPPEMPSTGTPYITDSELYLDGRTLEEELGDYKPFEHNEPDGHFPPPPDPVEAALSEYDQKWEPQVENDNFFFDEDFEAEQLSKSAKRSATMAITSKEPSSPSTQKPKFEALKGQNDENLNLPRDSDSRASSEIVGGIRKETEKEKQARREKLEEDFQRSSDQFAKDIAAVAKDDKARNAGKRAQALETERSETAAPLEPMLDCSSELFPDRVSSAKDTMRQQKSLTGNFVQDFAEDYAFSWRSEGGVLVPKIAKKMDITGSSPSTAVKSDSEFSRNPGTPRLQTSLERQQAGRVDTADSHDPYATEPIGLQVSYANECAEQGEPQPPVYVSSYGTELPQAAKTKLQTNNIEVGKTKPNNAEKKKQKALMRQIRSIYEDTYGMIDINHRQPITPIFDTAKAATTPANKEPMEKVEPSPNDTSAPSSRNPTRYKILAYNPETQSIDTAETTSIVPPENQMPLSPAVVLLRISKPSKFLPHIAPLLAEGYEIASGNGNILVFRKVRDGPPASPPIPKSEPQAPARKLTNPIDGMQSIRPATGNFASPTGFVNHDLPEYVPEPFKSGIDVRREEAAFSGRGSGWQDRDSQERGAGKKRRGNTAKRLIVGAAWVGALSYAVGVVAEFFRTGGVDGKGAVGL